MEICYMKKVALKMTKNDKLILARRQVAIHLESVKLDSSPQTIPKKRKNTDK